MNDDTFPERKRIVYLCRMRQELLQETIIITSRASGPGGQHVNKTESKVELHWNLYETVFLTNAEKLRLKRKLSHRLTDKGVLILVSQETRSQLKNRQLVQLRFLEMIERSLKPEKRRIPTKPTRASREKRLKSKKSRSAIKKDRQKPGSDI